MNSSHTMHVTTSDHYVGYLNAADGLGPKRFFPDCLHGPHCSIVAYNLNQIQMSETILLFVRPYIPCLNTKKIPI